MDLQHIYQPYKKINAIKFGIINDELCKKM